MILAVDPLHKIIFSFWYAAFSLFAAEVMRNAFTRVLIDLGGIKYIDKSNMLQACTSPLTVILVLLFLFIMTFSALFEIGGLLHSFSMAQIGRKTDICSMIAAGARTCRKTFSPRNWPVLLFVVLFSRLTPMKCNWSALRASKDELRRSLPVCIVIAALIISALIAFRLYMNTRNPVYREIPYFGLYLNVHTRWLYPLSIVFQELFIKAYVQSSQASSPQYSW